MRNKKHARVTCPICGRKVRVAFYPAKDNKPQELSPESIRKFGYEVGGVKDGLDKTPVKQSIPK